MSRRTARKHAYELIFQLPFHDAAAYDEIKDFFLSEIPEEEREFIEAEFSGVVNNLNDIDAKISGSLTGWVIDRINKSDLAVLRLALYEMSYSQDIPVSVAINEAVDLAREYGSDESYGFVNAVLGKLANG